MTTDLHGGAALITGGGSGIGRGIALACADEGMNVIVADIEADAAQAVADELAQKEVRSLAVQLDVSNRDALEALAERVYDEFGELRLLCNNAGVLTSRPLDQATRADWEWTFAVNLYGVVDGVDVFLPRLRAQEGPAHILITASVAGLRPNESIPVGVYSASKHACLAYAEVLHDELAPDGIGVSALCPGGVRTKIGVAERNRPESFGGPSLEPAFAGADTGAFIAMPPEEAGRIALRGVKANRRLILTHPDTRAEIEARYQRIMDDYDFLEAANAE